ncbi:hypothetical protein TWF594_010990 [Orbilia oligospora]|nr:hypothetical protein TWF706_007509 [Orbilia oligospora]KAF3129375.1 hypothetical protein TWF594_010990 [Orbilia oligospora]
MYVVYDTPMSRPPPLFFTFAFILLLLTVIYTNFSSITSTTTTMFSRLSRFREKVHDKFHAGGSSSAYPGQQAPPIPEKPHVQHKPPPIPPKPVSAEAYAILRKRWMNIIVGDFDHIDSSSKEIQDRMTKMSTAMDKLLETYNPTDTQVFNNCGPFCATTVHFKNTCGRLLALAITWATPGTRRYQDLDVLQKILYGIDVVFENFFVKMADDIKKCIETRQNWWNIQIGAPQNLADLGVILYHHLHPTRRQEIGAKIVELVGNPFIPSLKGGNRSWVSRILIVAGIFTDNSTTIYTGIRCLSADGGNDNVRKNTLFGYIKPGDGEGLYKDGSLISHDVYPYAGGYGLIMLGSLARLLNLLNSEQSPHEFRVQDEHLEIIYHCVERNFMPVVWQGIIFEHVRGRGIARREGPGWDNGHLLVHATALLTLGSPSSLTPHLSSYVRLWQSTNPGDIFRDAEIPQISTLQAILSNPSLPIAPSPKGCFATPMQEHFAYHSLDDNWCFTISMSSTRIGRAETLNNENLKSWYQGDGMTYLYTSTHKTHYGDDYWPTMDPLHCPGTTNHQTPIPSPMPYKSMGYKPWSGGVCWASGGWGNGVAYGSNSVGARFVAISMDHLALDKHSSAKKSWYLTDRGIFALGASVSSDIQPGTEVHTTIESRNLDQPGRMVVINGEEYTDPPGWVKKSNRVHWAWLENTGGYIFLDAKDRTPTEMVFTREKRCGCWKDVTGDGKPDEICREYVNIVANHGVNPKEGKYAYAALPLATREETEYLQANPTWNVIRNDGNAQALEYRFDEGEVIFITFWNRVEVKGIRVEERCQVIWGRWKGEWCLSVSDPQHQNNCKVVVDVAMIRDRGLRVRRSDEGVTVDGSKVIIEGLKNGATKSICFGERDEL